MYVLYQGPLFNQSVLLLLSISYFIYLLEQIIHNIPTWCNIVFNTNLEIISSNVNVVKYKPVSFLQLIHLIDMTSTLFLSSIKLNSNMENTFNNEVIIPCFVFITFALCSIMVVKGDHIILSFVDVGNYMLLSWQSIYVLSEFLDRLESILFSYTSASRLSFRYWINSGWLISFNRGTTYALNMLIIISFLSLNYFWI